MNEYNFSEYLPMLIHVIKHVCVAITGLVNWCRFP
jgi:hypothetical protein